MKAAIYARVSTTDQTNAIQIRELKEYVERRGWEPSRRLPRPDERSKGFPPWARSTDSGCPTPEIRRGGRLEA